MDVENCCFLQNFKISLEILKYYESASTHSLGTTELGQKYHSEDRSHVLNEQK